MRRVEADYLRPARFDDELIVRTGLREITGARIMMEQKVERDDATLFTAIVTIVCLNETGAPRRLPADIRARLARKLH